MTLKFHNATTLEVLIRYKDSQYIDCSVLAEPLGTTTVRFDSENITLSIIGYANLYDIQHPRDWSNFTMDASVIKEMVNTRREHFYPLVDTDEDNLADADYFIYRIENFENNVIELTAFIAS